jgi:tetratricopeptide (TPR) repeat protein
VELAGTYTNLGRLIGDNGQLEESLPWLNKSVDSLEAAHRQDSRSVKVRESLLVASWARAMTLAGLRRFQPAAQDWTRAIELDDGHYHNTLRLKRASTLLNQKDHAGAAADAQDIADFAASTGQDLYSAACVFAHSAGLARKDAPAAESYGSRAVAVLRRAFAKGYGDQARFKKDADLEQLQGREDFKELIRELESSSGVKKKDLGAKQPVR